MTIMKQELVPALMDIDARIAVKDGQVEKKPHGHGRLLQEPSEGIRV